jgi:hypothetical protein
MPKLINPACGSLDSRCILIFFWLPAYTGSHFHLRAACTLCCESTGWRTLCEMRLLSPRLPPPPSPPGQSSAPILSPVTINIIKGTMEIHLPVVGDVVGNCPQSIDFNHLSSSIHANACLDSRSIQILNSHTLGRRAGIIAPVKINLLREVQAVSSLDYTLAARVPASCWSMPMRHAIVPS